MDNAEHNGNLAPPGPIGAARTNGSAEVAESYVDHGGGRDQVERVLDALWRGKWIILLVFLLVFCGVAAYTYTLDPVYQASSLVLVSRPQPSPGAQFGYGAQGSFGRSDRSLANEMLVLRNSLDIAREVAKRLRQMRTVPGTDDPLPILYAEGSTEPLPVEVVAQRVQSRMYFGQERDVDVIRMTATSVLPAEAALLADQYMQEYVDLTRRSSRRQAEASVDFLEEQVAQTQDTLERAEVRIEQFMDRAGTISIDQEASQLIGQISNAEAARDEAQLELEMRRATLQSIEQRLDSIGANLPRRLSSSVEEDIATVQERLTNLQARKSVILANNQGLSPEAPRLQEINQEIAGLREQKERLTEQYIDEVMSVSGVGVGGEEGGGGPGGLAQMQRQAAEARLAVQGIESRIGVLNERLSEANAELGAIPEQSLELARLRRDRSNAEQTYQAFMQRLQDARIEEASEPGYAEVIRGALVPHSPVRPNTRRNILAGFFGGLFLGIGLALARSALDKRIYKPEELREQGRNVIGVVPDMDAFVRDEHGGEAFVEQGGRRFETSLASLLSPMSSAAEAYRHLRTNIQFSFPDKKVKTVLVTSATMGEGKSVTAANLAVVMAQAGKRTLLIDADLRRPRLHKILDVPREPGLVKRLFSENGTASKGAVTEEMGTGVDNLYVLTAGQSTPNPAELVGSESMGELMDAFQGTFDVIVIDSPPVLAATDAALLSTRCDATVVVARAAQVRTYELDHCVKSLQGVGARIVGVLFNGFDASKGYGYRYGYHYYYDAYSEDHRGRKKGFRRTVTDRLKSLQR